MDPTPPPLPPPPPPPPLSLGDLLHARTPRLWVTPAIVAIDFALYLAMLVTSGEVAFSEATAVAWGAQSTAAIAAGEWWRLLTAMWLHGHPPHLLLNMLVLWQLGGVVERLLGPLVFLIVYVLTGVIASVASLEYHGTAQVSVGASGAIFGIAGVLLVIAFAGSERRSRQRQDAVTTLGGHLATPSVEPPALPRPRSLGAMLAELRGGLITFVAYNALAGAVLPQVDNAAHFGGLAGGIAVGWLVGRRSLESAPRLVHAALPIALTAALAAWAVQRLTGAPDVRVAHVSYAAAAAEADAAFASALADVRAGRRTPASLAAEIERDVLPPLEARRKQADVFIREAFARVNLAERRDPYGRMMDWRRLPGFRHDLRLATAWAVLLAKRDDAWRLRIRALRANEPALIEQARRLEASAVRAFEAVRELPRPEDQR
jgi:rhomboid protease GluP